MAGRVPGPLGVGSGGTLEMTPGPLGNSRSVQAPQLSYDDFKRAVLERQIHNAQANGRQYYPPVPDDELDALEGSHRLRTAAAQSCRALLAAGRAALAEARTALDPLALRTTAIGVGSSYRDYAREVTLWDGYYPAYYKETQVDRDAAAGGPHGPAAVQILAKYISPKKAAPGFSNHSDGIAVDFTTTFDNVLLTDKSPRATWRQTWFHPWLVRNAVTHRFQPLASEEWHWDYR